MTPRAKLNPPVFGASALLLLLFLGIGVVFTDQAAEAFPRLLEATAQWGGWIYVVSIPGFIVLALWLAFGRHGSIRLGPDDARPDFSTLSWFSMLFSAGMGIGLVFYGVAEPILHYQSLPGVAPESPEALARAVPVTLFHWGIHAWSCYLLLGLALAYFAYRQGLPLSIRSCLHPLLGDRIHGAAGHVVDVLAVFGTLFGLATSLGLGAMQISAGLEYVFGTPHGPSTQLLLIGSITLVATVSLLSGVHRGIRRLSELNLLLATVLLLFVLAVGPTGHILASLGTNLGGYARELTTRTFAFDLLTGESAEWSRTWTVFYWGWWIAWAPFVGTFVARISRGRTIREFVLALLLVPPLVALVWFTVFGDTALHMQVTQGGIARSVAQDLSTAVYVILDRLPLATLTSFLTTAVVAVFFVTSSDSASFVVDMITSGGHPNPPRWQRVFWAVAEGACAAVLLYAGGRSALTALQAAVVSIGLPFCLIIVGMAVSLVRALREEASAPP